MKKFIYSLSVLLSSMALAGCSDFFEPDTDDELQGADYISSDTEMYTGFLGIMTKIQAIGDKEILLTDTRGELLEMTPNSTPELVALYNYNSDLTGNSYADPAPYYDVIIACNDYLIKLNEYQHLAGVPRDKWEALVSSTVRVKVWIYKTLAEIYGQAVWFDSPVLSLTEISAAKGFTLMKLPELIDKCISLMDTGIYGVPSNLELVWSSWLQPDVALADSKYRFWDSMVVPYEGLYAELLLWKAACIESTSAAPDLNASATYDLYKRAFSIIVNKVTEYASAHITNKSCYWIPCGNFPGKWHDFFDGQTPHQIDVVAAILYDYTNNQTNSLLKHFSNDYPNKYLLAPSEVGIARWTDEAFSPGSGSGDTRGNATVYLNWNGANVIQKYRKCKNSSRANAYQDDVHIYIYRSLQYHLLMCECANHIKNFDVLDALLNKGVSTKYVEGDPIWEGFNSYWTQNAPERIDFASTGMRGYMNLGSRPLITDMINNTARQMYRHNDIELIKESCLEFACEGKTYPLMNRMALRYNDPSIVADFVCPKYEATGKAGEIRAKIEAGGNWVPYDLQYVGSDEK